MPRVQKREVVKIVNKIRRELGLKSIRKLPLGKRKRLTMCPIAEGIKMDGGPTKVSVGGSRRAVFTPLKPLGLQITPQEENLLYKFMAQFDRGEFPELDITKYG